MRLVSMTNALSPSNLSAGCAPEAAQGKAALTAPPSPTSSCGSPGVSFYDMVAGRDAQHAATDVSWCDEQRNDLVSDVRRVEQLAAEAGSAYVDEHDQCPSGRIRKPRQRARHEEEG